MQNEDTRQRYVEVETHRHKDTEAPKGTGKGSGGSNSKKPTPEACLCCGKEGHKKADCKFKTATCSNCGKVGHLRAVCRNANTPEMEKDADQPSPEVTVEAVWCNTVDDDGHATYSW